MRRILLLCAVCALGASGCLEFEPAAMTPVRGRAFFVRHYSTISSEIWVCDASSGRPICYAAASGTATANPTPPITAAPSAAAASTAVVSVSY